MTNPRFCFVNVISSERPDLSVDPSNIQIHVAAIMDAIWDAQYPNDVALSSASLKEPVR